MNNQILGLKRVKHKSVRVFLFDCPGSTSTLKSLLYDQLEFSA